MRRIDLIRALLSLPFVIWHAGASAQPDGGADPEGLIFASDFASLSNGDFPVDLTFRSGGMQIDSSQGGKMLRFEGGSWFQIELGSDLPENFAIEFDYYTNEYNAVLFVSVFDAAVSGQSQPSYSGFRQGAFNFFSIANTVYGVSVDRAMDSLPQANAPNSAFTENVVPIRIEVRGNQARVYVDGDQVVIHPAATIPRTDVVEFFYGSVGSPGNGYLGDIRIFAL